MCFQKKKKKKGREQQMKEMKKQHLHLRDGTKLRRSLLRRCCLHEVLFPAWGQCKRRRLFSEQQNLTEASLVCAAAASFPTPPPPPYPTGPLSFTSL